jgi:hypothetical protein
MTAIIWIGSPWTLHVAQDGNSFGKCEFVDALSWRYVLVRRIAYLLRVSIYNGIRWPYSSQTTSRRGCVTKGPME